ncbi:hypothetical protein TcG_00493 [Trypanosoma cruzi]|nr:hypothetical protein TcG_00493 [Trypanosoma cruzi]
MVRLRSSVQIPTSHGFPAWAPVCRVKALPPLARHELVGSFDCLCHMGRIPTSRGRSGGELRRALLSADGHQVVVPFTAMSKFCNGANRMRTAWNCAWTSELHANIFCPPTEHGHTHMDQCRANCLQVPPTCSKQWCASSSSERLEWTQGSSAR